MTEEELKGQGMTDTQHKFGELYVDLYNVYDKVKAQLNEVLVAFQQGEMFKDDFKVSEHLQKLVNRMEHTKTRVVDILTGQRFKY